MRVVNGSRAFHAETSKALQLSVLRSLGLLIRPRASWRRSGWPAAAAESRFPIVVKPGVGGAGGRTAFRHAGRPSRSRRGEWRIGTGARPDGARSRIHSFEEGITRVEVLGGKLLYAIRVYSSGETFNLCPADVCQTTEGTELVRSACPADAPRNGLRVEGYEPPVEVARQVEQIAAACGIEVGGIEYAVDARDGRLYYYDVNALSNFVADAPRVVGFDPFARLADFLVREAR